MATPPRKGPVMLVVMDGIGLRKETAHNAFHLAQKPHYDQLTREFPFTEIITCGTDVGLPKGTMGNSEVGHLNIGAGRVVWQELMRIGNAIADLSFYHNPAFVAAIEHAKKHNSRLHLFGLISGAFVHSCEEHYFALVRMARQHGLTRDRVVLHVFTDGRDTPPRSAPEFVGNLQSRLDLYDTGVVGTVIGRYYAMDRDKRWSRVKLAYEAMVNGACEYTAASAEAAISAAHKRADAHPKDAKTPAEADEFIRPTAILGADGKPQGLIRDNDALISFNHRSDRPREIIRALIEEDFETKTAKDPDPGFVRSNRPKNLFMATMTDYRAGFDVAVAFDSKELSGTIAEAVSAAGLKQFHIAETEKYPHVTFFFNGGREAPFPGEERYMAASPKVATYDLKPEMSAEEVTQHAVEAIRSKKFDFLVLNFANGDMVGHTGVEAAAVKAVETVDKSVGEIVKAIRETGGDVLITADHGNCEQMWDDEANCPHTAHTTNNVPCFLVSERFKHAKLRSGGRLGDLAPTLMFLLGLPPSKEMEGRNLIEA
ncbi:MAG: 2,3-bisphosphoglycerate-independent phosphoglycerate mutase [Planctomycetota bacterium]|nr:2,3-bisphosphoglycerate-independent phosphoglycerate mutase [Planctomycetota bacterium]